MRPHFFVLAFLFATTFSTKAEKITLSIDPLLDIPASWSMTVDEFEQTFGKMRGPHFRWLTSDKTRARLNSFQGRNHSVEISAFGGEVPMQEVIVDFAGGKLNLVSVSIFNRADNSGMTLEELKRRFKVSGKKMSERFKNSPRRREADSKNGLLTEGFSWYSRGLGVALLEHNEQALEEEGEREFLRLRVARPKAKGGLAKSMTHTRGGASVRLRDLEGNVTEADGGDIFIADLPMVDQGDKGYCVVATVQRVFEYYGIGADMHQIAEISEANPDEGTSTLQMALELDKIDYRFKTRLDIIGMGQPLTEPKKIDGQYYVGKPVEQRKFEKEIKKYVDDGLPLLWSLRLGMYPEVPNLSPQTSGGHMRLIIGYNEETGDVIFSDSWGAGHESKRMKMDHAYRATTGLFVLKPTVH